MNANESADRISISEAKVMNIIWDQGPITAKEISMLIEEQFGWKNNTTYTVISKLIAKGMVYRKDPGYICSALISRDEMRRIETRNLIEKMFNGSRKLFFSSLMEDDEISDEEMKFLKDMISKNGNMKHS